MIIDSFLALSGSITGNTVTGQTITGTGVTVVSTNTVDVASQGVPSGQVRDMAAGQDLWGRFQVTTAASGGTSVEMQIISATDAALSTGVVVLGTTGPIAIASLVLGARFVCALNPRLAGLGARWLGARFITVGAVTAGAYYADVGVEYADNKTYPSGFAVL